MTQQTELVMQNDSRSTFPKSQGFSETIVERFWQRITQPEDPASGCWIWTGYAASNGYGTIARGIRNKGPEWVHRVSWMIHFGPIPESKFVCHICDTPLCVRPDHLFLGTPADNIQDMISKGRGALQNFPEKSPKAKLNRFMAQAIRRAFNEANASRSELVEAFGVSRRSINAILARETWTII